VVGQPFCSADAGGGMGDIVLDAMQRDLDTVPIDFNQ
jgi:hypothetical protein